MGTVHDFQVLDHGFVRSVDIWGSEEAIIEAARMSTQKGFLGWSSWKCSTCGLNLDHKQVHTREPGIFCENGEAGSYTRDPRDEKLLAYLWKNKHATPFEFAGLVIDVQAPIFVFREWHRHRTQSYNEMSARYAPLPDLNYIPTTERILLGGGHLTKQAGAVADAEALTVEGAEEFRKMLAYTYTHAEQVYQSALKKGVPKELARVHLPVGRYSRMRASACLRNWLAFITLRSAPSAQYEIRQFSDAVGKIIAAEFPRTWALFSENKS